MKLVSSVKKGDGFKPCTILFMGLSHLKYKIKHKLIKPITNNHAVGTNSKTLGQSTLSPGEDLLCTVETSRSTSKWQSWDTSDKTKPFKHIIHPD